MRCRRPAGVATNWCVGAVAPTLHWRQVGSRFPFHQYSSGAIEAKEVGHAAMASRPCRCPPQFAVVGLFETRQFLVIPDLTRSCFHNSSYGPQRTISGANRIGVGGRAAWLTCARACRNIA